MNSWSAKNFICPTPLLIFYLKEGCCVKYHWCIAYERGKPFKDFIDNRTRARIEADLENKPAKAKLNKDINNSTYGRLSMNLRFGISYFEFEFLNILKIPQSKRCNLKHGSGSFDNQALHSRYLKEITPLFCEDDTCMSFEYTLKKKGYTDSIPVHVGSWILATSKLHLLEVFVKQIRLGQNICLDFESFGKSSIFQTFEIVVL